VHHSLIDIFAETEKIYPRIRDWRRTLHHHPELGFQERRTSALVAKILNSTGWNVTSGLAKTGVVGLLKGSKSGPTIAIRADMDALPIQEQNTCAYASCVPGVMHACGHDGNTAMVLGAALLLSRFRTQLSGNIKLIFQPCEEVPPGGAQAMIQAGVLEAPKVNAIIAGHVDASLPVGTIGVKTGTVMAAADAFTLTIQGKGGHGAMPHKSVDAIAIAGQIISNLQNVIAREIDPLVPAVVSLGKIEGGTAYNVIADKVCLRGTLRTLDSKQRRELPQRVKRIVQAVARAHRGQCTFELEPGHPALVNDAKISDCVRRAGWQVLGRNRVKELTQPVMSGEDFTYFAARVPACFFRVGVSTANKRYQYPWHHPKFDLDEHGLVTGTAVLVRTALDFLTL